MHTLLIRFIDEVVQHQIKKVTRVEIDREHVGVYYESEGVIQVYVEPIEKIEDIHLIVDNERVLN